MVCCELLVHFFVHFPIGWWVFLILIYLFVAMHQLSLVAVSRGYSPVAVQEILTGVASLIAEHGLWCIGSIVVAHRLDCSAAWGIFLDQESNSCPLHWQGIVKHGTTKKFLLDGFVFFFLISLIAFLNVFLHTYYVLKLNIQKTKIMVSSPIMSWQIDGETM